MPEQPIPNLPDVENALIELKKAITALNLQVNQISELVACNKFKFLSKNVRNSMSTAIIEEEGKINDLVKVTFRQLKKIKRERPAEEVVDALLVNSLVVHQTPAADHVA